MAALKISVVGVPGTGRSRLSADLHVKLTAAGRDAVVAVSDGVLKDSQDLIFLMGLDLPSAASVHADNCLRATLLRTGAAYTMLYGTPDERLSQALMAIEKRLVLKLTTTIIPELFAEESLDLGRPQAWIWPCDKCSDPQCEHKLLTGLLAARVAIGPTEPSQAEAVAGQGG